MRLKTQLVPGLAKLAWVAVCRPEEEFITVRHGPSVEVVEGWCVEAVWAGDFAAGDFDRTDLVFGTGVRCRGDRVVFVTSGTTMDRLWHCRYDGACYVANSLPLLLAAADMSLLDDRHYFRDIRTICEGLDAYRRSIPASPHPLNVQYFHNLVWDGLGLTEAEKPDFAPDFASYADYYGFLQGAAERLGANLAAPHRRHRIASLTTVSSGYDSCAAAVVAKWAGCARAVTIGQSNSLWRGSDSGADVAERLGLECAEYGRTAKQYPHEASVWAATGRAGVLNWTQFDYPEPLCLFFTGCRGDRAWNRADGPVPKPFSTPSVGDLGLCEFRLIRGIFHCPVPLWGIRHIGQIRAVSRLPEMQPWTLGTDYDRPIARRMVEDADVPRDSFAVRKKNASSEHYFVWPYSPEARASFARFLRERHLYVPSDWLVAALRPVVTLDRLVFLNVTSKLGLPDVALRTRLRFRANFLLFHWGNEELRRACREALDAAVRGTTQSGGHAA